MLKLCACVLFLFCAAADSMMVGGKTAAKKGSNDIELDFAREELYKFFSSTRNQGLSEYTLKVIGSTVQLVAGEKHDFALKLKEKKSGQVEICEVSVWYRAWLTEDFQNQLSGPIKCGVPRAAQIDLDEQANSRSNNLMWMTMTGTPTLTEDGNNFKLTDVPMATTSCTRQQARKFVGFEDFYTVCAVANDAKPLMTCSATVSWNGTAFEANDVACKNASS